MNTSTVCKTPYGCSVSPSSKRPQRVVVSPVMSPVASPVTPRPSSTLSTSPTPSFTPRPITPSPPSSSSPSLVGHSLTSTRGSVHKLTSSQSGSTLHTTGCLVTVNEEDSVIYANLHTNVMSIGDVFMLNCKRVFLSTPHLSTITLVRPTFISNSNCLLKGIANVVMIEPVFRGINLKVNACSAVELLSELTEYTTDATLSAKKGLTMVSSPPISFASLTLCVRGDSVPVANDKSGIQDINGEGAYWLVTSGYEGPLEGNSDLGDQFTIFRLDSMLKVNLNCYVKKIELTDIVLSKSELTISGSSVVLARVKVDDSLLTLKDCSVVMSGLQFHDSNVTLEGCKLECSTSTSNSVITMRCTKLTIVKSTLPLRLSRCKGNMIQVTCPSLEKDICPRLVIEA